MALGYSPPECPRTVKRLHWLVVGLALLVFAAMFGLVLVRRTLLPELMIRLKLGGTRRFQRGDLRGAQLAGADLQSFSLNGARLSRSELSSANLQGAFLQNADLNRSRMANARLQRARLNSADLQFADLSGATLFDANLRGARLDHANLRGADLRATRLENSRFINCDLSGADLSGARLHYGLQGGKPVQPAVFKGIRYDARTRWPADFDPRAIQSASDEIPDVD